MSFAISPGGLLFARPSQLNAAVSRQNRVDDNDLQTALAASSAAAMTNAPIQTNNNFTPEMQAAPLTRAGKTGVSLAELQGRLQTNAPKTKGATGQEDPVEALKQQAQKTIQSVQQKLEMASTQGISSPSQAIQQLQAAFAEIGDVQKQMNDIAGSETLPPALMAVEANLTSMSNQIASKTASLLHSTGINVDQQGAKDILTDGYLNKAKPLGEFRGNNSGLIRQQMHQQADGLLDNAQADVEKNPNGNQTSVQSAIEGAKSVLSMLSDFGNTGYLEIKISRLQSKIGSKP